MRCFNFDEQIIVYVIHNGEGNWYISDKEIWFLDYSKRLDVFKNIGYEIKEEYVDERRRDLLCLDENSAHLFMKRIESERCSISTLKELVSCNDDRFFKSDFCPSLYIDFDKCEMFSMYSEYAAYENYAPVGWKAKYKRFLDMIPREKQYWIS